MAIQIFGTAKNFDFKKAERYFAERQRFCNNWLLP